MKIVVVHPYRKPELFEKNPYLFGAIKKYGDKVIAANNKDIDIILTKDYQVVKVNNETVTPQTHRFYFPNIPLVRSIIPALIALGFDVTPSIDKFSRSKLYQYVKYSQAGINMPKTSLKIDKSMPCVVEKPIVGSLGNEVSLIDNPDSAVSKLKYLYQEYIDNSEIGERNDIRAIFYKDNLIGSFKKVCVNPSKTIATNIAKGNRGERYELSDKEIEFCKNICHVFEDKKLHAIDYIYDNNGELFFLENNDYPVGATCKFMGTNFYECIIELMIKENEKV